MFSATGRKLTRQERKGAEYIFKMTAYLDEEGMTKLMANIDSQIDLEDAILKYFPEAERGELGKMIAAPFAQVSDLSFLKGAYALAGEKLSAGDLSSWDRIKELQDLADREDETVKFLAIAVQRLRKNLMGRTDIENPEAVEKFIAKYENYIHDIQKILKKINHRSSIPHLNRNPIYDKHPHLNQEKFYRNIYGFYTRSRNI